MPYRRLPNTDQARIRALKAVVVKGDIYNVYDLAVSLKTLTDARNFLMKFEAAQAYYAECFERQSKAGRKHQSNVKIARLYISHFIQVLNLAVIRSEIRTAHKEYYGLDMKSNNVPDLSTEQLSQSGDVRSLTVRTDVFLKVESLFIILPLPRSGYIMIFLWRVMRSKRICRP